MKKYWKRKKRKKGRIEKREKGRIVWIQLQDTAFISLICLIDYLLRPESQKYCSKIVYISKIEDWSTKICNLKILLLFHYLKILLFLRIGIQIFKFFAGSAFNSDLSALKSAVFHESMANKICSVNQWRMEELFFPRAEVDDSIGKLAILVDPPEFHEPASRYKL